MPRQTPVDRLPKLIDAAAAAFVEHGFSRTQMDDIAVRLGVAKGTIYRSVESKEALLAAVLLHGDDLDTLPATGPIDMVDLGELSAIVRDRLAAAIGSLAISEAANRECGDDLGDEVERLARELYAMMQTHRVRIMVLDRCAPDLPELAGDWYRQGRYAVADLWVAYLNRRADLPSAAVDVEMLARTIVEIVTLWAVKMPWDPSPRPYAADPATPCAAMIRNLVTGAQT